MPMPKCCCYGGNTPELERYCACQGTGDRAHFDRVNEVMKPHLENANAAYYAGDETAAYEHVYRAYDAASAVQK